MLDSQAARSFVEQILAQTGTTAGLDEATHEEIVRQMLEQLTEMVNAELLDSLNAHQMRHLEHLLDANQAEQIDGYLDEQGVSRHEVVARAMRRMLQEYQGE